MPLRIPVGKSLYSRAVLADTGAILALANSRDRNHGVAEDCLRSIHSYRLPIYAPLPIIYETHKRLLFDLGPASSKRFLDSVRNNSVIVIRTIVEDEQEAKLLIERYQDLRITLFDAVSMAIMLRVGIAVSFSFDRHFLQAGFIRIPPFHLQ